MRTRLDAAPDHERVASVRKGGWMGHGIGVVMLAVVSACGDAAPDSPAITVPGGVVDVIATDSAGIELVDVIAVPGIDDPDVQWTFELVRSIEAGGVAADEEPLLYDPMAVTRLDDGTIVVIDRGEDRVIVIDAAADTIIARFGRTGHGPGEIYDSGPALWPGDDRTIWIGDHSNSRAMQFTLTGRLVREVNWTAALSRPAEWRVTPDANELVADIAVTSTRYVQHGHDSLAVLDLATERFRPLMAIPQRFLSGPTANMLWAPRLLWAALPSDEVVVGRSDAAIYDIRSRSGAFVRRIRLPLTLQTISDAEMAEVYEEISGIPVSAAAASIERRIAPEYPIHNDMLPLADSVFATLQGRRGRAAEDPALAAGEWYWRTIWTSGRRIGTIHFPHGFRPRWVGAGRVIGMHTDSQGIGRLQEYLLRPPT